MPLAPPADIACELIHRIETTTLDQALGEAERHRRVIGPLAGLKAERPTSNDVGNRLERSRRAKLQSCAERVASGQSQQTATVAVNGVHGFTLWCEHSVRSRSRLDPVRQRVRWSRPRGKPSPRPGNTTGFPPCLR